MTVVIWHNLKEATTDSSECGCLCMSRQSSCPPACDTLIHSFDFSFTLEWRLIENRTAETCPWCLFLQQEMSPPAHPVHMSQWSPPSCTEGSSASCEHLLEVLRHWNKSITWQYRGYCAGHSHECVKILRIPRAWKKPLLLPSVTQLHKGSWIMCMFLFILIKTY